MDGGNLAAITNVIVQLSPATIACMITIAAVMVCFQVVRSGQNEGGEISAEVPAGGEDKVKAKMEPERITVESSSAGTDVEGPGPVTSLVHKDATNNSRRM